MSLHHSAMRRCKLSIHSFCIGIDRSRSVVVAAVGKDTRYLVALTREDVFCRTTAAKKRKRMRFAALAVHQGL